MYAGNCKDIFMLETIINGLRLGYLFYLALLAKSFYRRIERGELILVSHGKSIVELVNTIQN